MLVLSHIRVHVYVEGRDADGFFYDRLCDAAVGSSGTTYRLYRADELQGAAGGGKPILIAFFQYLRASSSLSRVGHHTTLFLLDKDIDDLERRLRRSSHVVYTPSYDVEGLIYRYGDLSVAVAAALSLPLARTRYLGQSETWCRAAATYWSEWVALCLTARRLGTPVANFGSRSQVNEPLHAAADPTKVTAVLARVASRSSVPVVAVEMRFEGRQRQLAALQATTEFDRYFKGKWYRDILVSELRSRFASSHQITPAVGGAIETALVAGLDYSAPWGDFVRSRFQALAAAI